MNHLHLEFPGGVAGDMLLAALADAAGEIDSLAGLPALLGLDGVTVRTQTATRHGIGAWRVNVDVAHTRTHRGLPDITALLGRSGLSAPVQEMAGRVFLRLAEAEASVHRIATDKVHFHEVGADDALIDIAGCCHLIERLGVESITADRFLLGRGQTSAGHGKIPLPSPAVLELVRGWPVAWAESEGERTTPTGAAIVATLARSGRPPAGAVGKTGYGAGLRDDSDRPNIVRAILITTDLEQSAREVLFELVASIDDATGEELAHAAEILLGAGALDAYYAPLVMKKGRPGAELTVLSRPGDRDRLASLILNHSGSAGLRAREVSRVVLPRRILEVQTRFGPVRVKEFDLPDGGQRAAPEYEDCREAAGRDHPIERVRQEALAAYRALKEKSEGKG